jgi:hypothetical protein
MTPILPVPIMLPDFFFQIVPNVCSVLVVSFTALLYLAMSLISFLPESATKPSKPSKPESSDDTLVKEKRNEDRVTN